MCIYTAEETTEFSKTDWKFTKLLTSDTDFDAAAVSHRKQPLVKGCGVKGSSTKEVLHSTEQLVEEVSGDGDCIPNQGKSCNQDHSNRFDAVVNLIHNHTMIELCTMKSKIYGSINLFNYCRVQKLHQTGNYPSTSIIYKCGFCKYHTQHRGMYNRHVETHATGGAFKCEHCGHLSLYRREHKQHLQRHNGFLCEICGKSYTRKHDRDQHYSIKHKGMSL